MSTFHNGACACCADLIGAGFRASVTDAALDRRSFLRVAGSAGLVAAMPFSAFAAEGNYEAMVLGCIDPRMQWPVRNYLVGRKLSGKYSQFVIAGAAIGVVAEPFKDWHKAFWDNLGTSIQLHHIKRVIAIDHRDCGAAKIAYGADKVANPTVETETHRAAMMEFRKQVNEKHPALKVEIGLMALNGRMEMFA